MVHEGNKDEAEKCFQIGQKHFSAGNREKAYKFTEKAERLFPCERNRDFLDLLNRLNTTNNPSTNSGSSSGGTTPTGGGNTENVAPKSNVRNRARANSGGNSPTASDEYTAEQLEAVRKVKKCKDYYEILGVTKEAGDSDLKKAYRKLALQFHPDKNKAPGADEAFKAVGNAFAILSDPEKKKQYDLYGADEANNHSHRSSSHTYTYTRGQEADMTAEELFNMFFGGGGFYVRRGNQWETTSERTGFRHHRTAHRHNHHESSHTEQSSLSVFLQLLPLLFLLILSLASSLLNSEATYSLSPTSKFSVMKTTSNLGVSFYVKPDFSTEYKGSMSQLEQHVEEDYVATLRNACFKEKNYKENMIWRARSFGDPNMFRRAQDLKTSSCNALQNLYNNNH